MFPGKTAGLLLENDEFAFATGGEEVEKEGAAGNLTNLLYSLESLRKREGEDKEE